MLDRIRKITGYYRVDKTVMITNANYCYETITFTNEVDAQRFERFISIC